MISTKLLHALLFTPVNDTGRWGIPALFWGEPGVAKTDIIEGLGEAVGMPTETLSPGERGEGAFGVTPVPNATLEYMTYPPPDWKSKFDVAQRGVVFVDEINTAPPALQPPLLGLVLARRIGGAYLGGGVRVLGAANPPEIAAGGWDLGAPVANRFAHFSWECPSVEEWSAWLFGQAQSAQPCDPDAEEKRVLSNWAAPWARARGQVAGFLRRRPEFLHKRPPIGDPALSRAWPSPRTWSYAARAIASAEIHGLKATDAEEFIGACVGVAANEFVAWRAAADLPDPFDVLDGNVKFQHEPQRLDRTAAILSSCAAIVAPKDCANRDVRAKVLWNILGGVIKDAADIAVIPARQLVKANLSDLGRDSDVVTAKLFPIMQAMAGAQIAIG